MVREGRCERRDRGKCFEGRKWCSMFSLFMGNLILDVSLVFRTTWDFRKDSIAEFPIMKLQPMADIHEKSYLG